MPRMNAYFRNASAAKKTPVRAGADMVSSDGGTGVLFFIAQDSRASLEFSSPDTRDFSHGICVQKGNSLHRGIRARVFGMPAFFF